MNKISRNIFPFSVFCFSVILFAVSSVKGIGSPSFGDESGHMLGAFALTHGDILYKDYVDAHGPFIYMLSWMPALLVGFHGAYLLRCVPIATTLVAAWAIFYSPLFKMHASRFLGVAFWLGAMAFFWVAQGLNMDSYWIVGGDLMTIVLANSVLPAIFNIPISRKLFFLSGACLIFLCFTAYSFTPSAILLFFSICFASAAGRQKTIFYTVFGALSAGVVFLVWMFFYGDLKGYILYHFIVNQLYYAQYISFGIVPLFQSFIPSLSPNAIMNTLGTFSFYAGVLIVFLKAHFRLSAVLAVAALLLTQIRGGVEFQDGTFLVGSLALFALVLVYSLRGKPLLLGSLTFTFWAVCYAGQHHAVFSPYGLSEKDMVRRGLHLFRENFSVGFVQIIQKYTDKDDRLLVIPYNPDVYIYAGRLPMEKYHAYLPWEADYARHPWIGYERDLCQDLSRHPPPVIYFDHYKVWGKWEASDFIPCLNTVLTQTYQQSAADPYLYIRKDRLMTSRDH
ncbi:hypothetical protein [Acetobacter malorum]|nr:hypothetical protein [Acetobacter malorum]